MRSAIRIVAIAFGIVVALAGLEHGIGEILQGRVRPPALVFESWPESRFLEVLSGEPAMSVIPNLLVSGILTVIVSLGLLLWSATGLRMVHPGVGLIALSFLLLLVGGGLGPPLMLLIVGLAATRIEHPVSWWRKCSVEARPPILARDGGRFSWRASSATSRFFRGSRSRKRSSVHSGKA